GSRQLHEHAAAGPPRGETGNLHRRIIGVGAGGHVPAPAVPRADGEAAVEVAVAHRPAPVRTDGVDRVVGAVDVEEREGPVTRLDYQALTDRHVGHLRDPHRGHDGDPMAKTPYPAAAAGAGASQARSHSRRRPAFFTPTSKWSHGR